MSTLFASLLIIFLYLNVFDCEEDTCSANDETCKDPSIDETKRSQNETLGQYLLRKQEAWYAKSTFKPSTAMSIRMVNPNNKWYDVYWYNKYRDPSRIFKGPIKPLSLRSTNSYVGHVFYFTEHGAKPEEELWKFTVTKGINMYIFDPVQDENNPFYVKVKEQKTFLEEYQKDTGRAWVHHYPRPKPFLNIWSVQQGVGHIHKISTDQTFWKCLPDDFKSFVLC